MINPHFNRWVAASVSDFVNSNRANYSLWVEGQEPLNQEILDYWAELFIGGPNYVEPSKNYYIYDLDVRIGLAVKKDYRDGHLPYKIKGHFQSVLASGPINIYRLGNTLNVDDQSYLGCFQLRTDVNKPIDGFDWGQVSTDVRLVRATVEGFFRMENP